jgi:hypothetical protein
MDSDLIRIFGQVAGIGGLALGVFLLLFRDVIRKKIFPQLTKRQGFHVIVLFLVLVWSVALAGIGAWVWADNGATIETHGPGSPVVQGTNGNVTITNQGTPPRSSER